jgi:nucleobase:cation symporter-1, NCS1 family
MDVQTMTKQPGSDRPWSIETHGIDAIPDSERHGSPRDLFWIWFAANISVLSVTYGGFLVIVYRLNLYQAVFATVVGVIVSFLLVGFVSLAGRLAGAPTLVLSRAPFGVVGNALPTLFSYVSLVGFEIILTSLATLAVQTVLGRLGMHTGDGALAVGFVIIAALAIAISLLGHATIQRVQTWFTVAFGLLTMPFIALEVGKVDWRSVATLPHGRLVAGLIGGISIIMAGTGLTWTNAAADYSRYLPRNASSGRVIWWTVFGAVLPLIVLIVFGSLLAANNPSVATSPNPIGVLAVPLPTWFLVPYLVTAVGGLVAEVLMGSYSGGLNLLTLGLRIARYKSILIDSVLLVIGCVYILFFAPSFFAPFEGFLVTVGVGLAAWVAIFLIDMWLARDDHSDRDLPDVHERYGAVNSAGVISLVIATAAGWGLVTSMSPVFSWVGYLLPYAGGMKGAIGASSVGVIIAFALAGILYAFLSLVGLGREHRRLRGPHARQSVTGRATPTE